MSNLSVPKTATYLTVRQVADLFSVCTKTVRRWIASGTLPATKLGRDSRIARSDLKAFAAARSNTAAGHVL